MMMLLGFSLVAIGVRHEVVRPNDHGEIQVIKFTKLL